MITLARRSLPTLIQGGMGIAISHWRLARSVAGHGHLGVVSGTALDRVVAYRLQEGDAGGHLRRAFDAFPDRDIADRVFHRWFRRAGLAQPGRYRSVPMHQLEPASELIELTVLAAFAEIWLAKEGTPGPIGINLLEKVQLPTLPTLYGALLAGVDYVLMGAGIPKDIPGHLQDLCQHRVCDLRVSVKGGADAYCRFDPGLFNLPGRPLQQPLFLPIISSHVLARSLARIEGVDGFIVEYPEAGGHNAPPRGWTAAVNDGPTYGSRDAIDFQAIRELGKPFWLAGGKSHPGSLAEAWSLGATGIQVGTLFAFCSESGMDPETRKRALHAGRNGRFIVRTEGRGSPTGYPLKILDLPGTEGHFAADHRSRNPCRHGYLRSPYRNEEGTIGWNCPAEPIQAFTAKGGDPAECPDRRCVCSGLLATAGHAVEHHRDTVETPLVTSGFHHCPKELFDDTGDYDVAAVLNYLQVSAPCPEV